MKQTPHITSLEQLQVEKIRTLTEIEQCLKDLRNNATQAVAPKTTFLAGGTFIRFIGYGIMAVQTYQAIRGIQRKLFRRKR